MVLILVGAAVLTIAAGGYLESPLWQQIQAEQVIEPGPSTAHPGSAVPGALIARLRIPRIDLDVAIIEGTRPRDLLRAPGHLSGSAFPGEPQNCIVAGHRDLHFKRLGELRDGDRIELVRAGEVFFYQVESTQIVAPTRRDVLEPGNQALLTLITCYPFRYVGPAPKRYVVTALLRGRRVSSGAP